jgi:hypothetical protein
MQGFSGVPGSPGAGVQAASETQEWLTIQQVPASPQYSV